MKTKTQEYRDGGEGFIKWCNENVCVPIYPEGSDIPVWTLMGELPEEKNPETGRSYADMWRMQQEICLEALQMKDGRLKHRLIVLCWSRGDGKSLLACLIQLWKFCNWPRQQIMLGANSVSQIRFVHYDIIRDLILNSPRLLARITRKNIQEKEIRYTDDKGNVRSIIRAISSFSGIVSNISGFSFSEMFDMKNPKFYVQLDGSTRNIPNALGVIDSTVSAKSHVLYKLYETFKRGKDPSLYYSYRCSSKGKFSDFMNPNMTQVQLDSYREKFPLGEFERYFKNIWSAGAERVFTDEIIEATNFLGIDHQLNVHPALMEILTAKNKLVEQEQKIIRQGKDSEEEFEEPTVAPILFEQHKDRFGEWDQRLWPVSDIYTLSDAFGNSAMASVEDLQKIGDMYDTDWAIMAGMDRADPMKTRTAARTIVTAIAKGLAGSRSNPYPADNADAPRYLYFLLHLVDVEDHSIEVVKDVLTAIKDEYNGIDVFGTERWGAVDTVQWCEDNDILPIIYYPVYARQRTMFTELYLAYKSGRFKTPPVLVRGQKQDDILKEEASVFDHNPEASKSKFGSPEKSEKYGIQDDCMFSVGSAVYAGLNLGVDSFRERKGAKSFGMFFKAGGLLGKW